MRTIFTRQAPLAQSYSAKAHARPNRTEVAPRPFGVASLVAVVLFAACGYQLAARGRLGRGARVVHVEAPDVSRTPDPRLGPLLRRFLALELRRQGFSLRSRSEADLTLFVRVHALSASEVFVAGGRIRADDLELVAEATARGGRSGAAAWRSGRLVVRRPRPWGSSYAQAEAALLLASEALASDLARRIARDLAATIAPP